MVEVYHYLYRFSVERLHAFVSDTAMVSLFKYYFESQGPRRILKSDTMRKYKDAYLEAGDRVIESLNQQTRVIGGYPLELNSGTTAQPQPEKTTFLATRNGQTFKSHGFNEQAKGLSYKNSTKVEGSQLGNPSTGSANLYPHLETNILQSGAVVPNFNFLIDQSSPQS